jgi:hypothetical protein
MRLGRVPG